MLNYNVNLEGKTVLVTGAAGFIGSNLVKRLFKDVKNIRVVGFDSISDYYDVNITTSHKDRSSGNYVRDFGAFVRFAGDAANVVARFDGKSSKDNGNRPLARVRLGDVDTTNTYNAAKGITYTNHVVFTCEEVEGTSVGGGNYAANSHDNVHGNNGGHAKSMDD